MSVAKIKENAFIGPQNREFIDSIFDFALYGKEKVAWETFKLVSKNFLGTKCQKTTMQEPCNWPNLVKLPITHDKSI